MPEPPLSLSVAVGAYPHTQALKSGRIASAALQLEFAEITPINRAFAPMVRERRFDVCEMAIATFLQAKAYGKELALLPIAMAARFQESALLCRADSAIRGPADLAGRRVGVRAYSQTTGMWLRGLLADDWGVKPEDVRWITFEGAHVLEYADPPFVERAAPGKELLKMLRERELDAVIVGNDVPDDPELRTVFPDPAAAAEAFWEKHRFVPINHMVVVRREIAVDRPDAIRELCRLFVASKAASAPPPSARDRAPMGREAVEPSVALALRFAGEQGLLPRPLTSRRSGRAARLRHCEFRTGLRPVPLDETTRSRVMPANAGIQNATSLSGFELFILSFSSEPQRYPVFPGEVDPILRRLVVSRWIPAFAGMTNRVSPDRFRTPRELVTSLRSQ